jgi:hypothetical protein
MIKIRHFLSILLLVCILTGCGGGSAEKVETPSGMNMQRGRNYKEVIEDFEDKGFTNIRTEPIEDLLFSWRFKNGEVEEISVGGDKNYDPGVKVPPDTEVVIRYHTYNTAAEDAEEEETSAAGGQSDSAKQAEQKTDQAAPDKNAKDAAEEKTEESAPAGEGMEKKEDKADPDQNAGKEKSGQAAPADQTAESAKPAE